MEVRRDSSLQETQKPQAKTKFGHTMSTYQQTACCTWRRFSRSWDKDMVSVRWIEWRTSMWTQLYGVYFCLALFKLQFSLVKITQKVCDLPTINPRNLWDSCIKWPRSWSLTRLQPQKPTSFLAQCHVWEVSVLNQSKAWESKIKWCLESRSFGDLDRIDGEPMEFEWKNHQDSPHWEFSTRFKRWWLNQSVNLSNSKEGSSSCQRTMTLIGENEETEKIVLPICSQSYWVCSKIHARTLVISGAWIVEATVRNPCHQTWWRVG